MNCFGYRHLMTITCLPVVASWLLQAFAPSLALLYTGRVIACMGSMIFTTICNVLMTELLEPKYRGTLGCLTEIVLSIGMLSAYLMATFLTWKQVTILCAMPFIPIFVLSLGVPEVKYSVSSYEDVEMGE